MYDHLNILLFFMSSTGIPRLFGIGMTIAIPLLADNRYIDLK